MDVVISMLFSSPIGLMSLLTIVSIIGIGLFVFFMIRRKMNHPEE